MELVGGREVVHAGGGESDCRLTGGIDGDGAAGVAGVVSLLCHHRYVLCSVDEVGNCTKTEKEKP